MSARRKLHTGPISPKVREQAAAARLAADLHAGTNGSHVVEFSSVGLIGFLRVHRSHFDDMRRALDAAEARCEQLDEEPDRIFARPPERLSF